MPVSSNFANRRLCGSSERGFSLVETLLVCVLIALISGLVINRSFSSNASGGFGAEQVLSLVETRVGERRSEALRLNSLAAPNSLEAVALAPIEIDFSRPETTASLVTDGTDRNADGVDDLTGEHLTMIVPNSDPQVRTGTWRYAYRDDQLVLPNGWKILDSLDGMPFSTVAPGGASAVSRIGFNAEGRAVHQASRTVETVPPGSGDSRFWAIYLVYEPSLGTASPVAFALAIYPSGLTERFVLDDGGWRGFKRRAL